MTLKKMSVAANDIVLNNLVMREKTFKTIPQQPCWVLLNAHFSFAQWSKIPRRGRKPSPWPLSVAPAGGPRPCPPDRLFPAHPSHKVMAEVSFFSIRGKQKLPVALSLIPKAT